MSALLHARCPVILQSDQRQGFRQATGHSATRSHLQQQPHHLSGRSSRDLSAFRRQVRSGRRELLQSTALLTLPTRSRSETSSSHSPPLSRTNEPSKNSRAGSSSSNDEDVSPQASCRPPAPPFRVTAPGRIVAGARLLNQDYHSAIATDVTEEVRLSNTPHLTLGIHVPRGQAELGQDC